MKNSIFLAISILFVGFSSAKNITEIHPLNKNEIPNIFTERNADVTKADVAWKEFWKTFLIAVKNQDKQKIKDLSDTAILGDDFFDSSYANFFTGDTRQKLLAAKDSDFNFSNKDSISELRKFDSIAELYLEGTGITYYFAKVNGKYKFVYVVVAG